MNRRDRRALERKQRKVMGLAKYLTRWVDVPHEPGERFLFRMPNWVIVEEARSERRRKVYGLVRETQEIVGAEIMAQWKEEQAEAESTALAPAKTPEQVLNEFDRMLFLKAGIAGWTYCKPQLDANGDPIYDAEGHIIPDRSKPEPVNEETIGELDEATQLWAGLTLIALTQSGFRPVMPEVTKNDDGVIEVRLGEDLDPLPFSSNSTVASAGTRA